VSRIDCVDFGEMLIDTLDLDPVYVLLANVRWSDDRMKRWLLAYWCFYHCGTCCWIVDQPDYWEAMRQADVQKMPRGRERRHFRAENSRKSIAYLSSRGVEALYEDLFELYDADTENPIPADLLLKKVEKWVGFGPWIAFKVVDMLECLGFLPIHFDVDTIKVYDTPRKGAETMLEMRGKEAEEVVPWAINTIIGELGPRLAPPRYERYLNAQEAETILCKWKSHINGHYEVLEDTQDIKRGLELFLGAPSSVALMLAGRRGGLWNA